MNWLAHLFLSEQKVDFQIGNFLADPLKGKVWQNASEEMRRGMQTHKAIDAYTDRHPIVSQSKSRLREKGLLKPVIIDLTYDYLLTKQWELFCTLPLQTFTQTFYTQAKIRADQLPKRPSSLVHNLVDHDHLNKYHSPAQLRASFVRIDKRLSAKLLAREQAVGYFEEVMDQIDSLEKDFLTFFPDLVQNIAKMLNADALTHWKI